MLVNNIYYLAGALCCGGMFVVFLQELRGDKHYIYLLVKAVISKCKVCYIDGLPFFGAPIKIYMVLIFKIIHEHISQVD
jgi:hypothetical protein